MKIGHFLTPNETRSGLRPRLLFGLLALAFFLSATAGVRANTIVIGTQGFNGDTGSITANTGDITTATVFTFGNVVSTNNWTGIFVGLPVQAFGSVTLDLTTHGFDLSSPAFGTFTSDSVTPISVVAPIATFAETGTWTAGSFFAGVSSPFGPITPGEMFPDAKYAIALTQVGGPDTAISFSGTLVVSEIPEPSGVVLVLTGLVAGAVMFGLRRYRFNNLVLR